jgi:hypothetical protein
MKLSDISQVNLSEAGMMQHADWRQEMDRIAAHWKEQGGDKMSDDELADAIGDDLEQLEYSPEEVADLVPAIISKIRGR